MSTNDDERQARQRAYRTGAPRVNCTTMTHYWLWTGSGSTIGAPEHLPCQCGRYTRQAWKSLESEIHRLTAEVELLTRERDDGWAEVARVASLVLRSEAEREVARAWSARWKEAARSYRRSARQNGESWQRACADISVLSADLDRTEAERNALREALQDTADVMLPDGTRCWCERPGVYQAHDSWCRNARAALAAAGGEAQRAGDNDRG